MPLGSSAALQLLYCLIKERWLSAISRTPLKPLANIAFISFVCILLISATIPDYYIQIMHAVGVCVCVTVSQSMCTAVFIFFLWPLPHVHVLACILVYLSTHVHPIHADFSLCVYVQMPCERTHTHTIECLGCHQGPFCAVSVSSCLKQTGRVHCVPSWHAPWDNERLYFGLDCWLRIIQQHKQATVQPCVQQWSVLGSKRQAQI